MNRIEFWVKVGRPKICHLALCPYVYSALCAVIPTLANFKANVLLIRASYVLTKNQF